VNGKEKNIMLNNASILVRLLIAPIIALFVIDIFFVKVAIHNFIKTKIIMVVMQILVKK
jgi:hypothetical protein